MIQMRGQGAVHWHSGHGILASRNLLRGTYFYTERSFSLNFGKVIGVTILTVLEAVEILVASLFASATADSVQRGKGPERKIPGFVTGSAAFAASFGAAGLD